MLTEVRERCDAIEECYEFMLAYAAQGLPSDEGSTGGRTNPRIHASRCQKRWRGWQRSFSRAAKRRGLHQTGDRSVSLRSLAAMPRDSLAAMELVLSQPAISSQLIDNLNSSIHLRALLTDLFLVGEILSAQAIPKKPVVTSLEKAERNPEGYRGGRRGFRLPPGWHGQAGTIFEHRTRSRDGFFR